MNHHRLKIEPDGRSVTASEGASLADVLRESGIPISFPCRQRGVCGKCLVEVVEGGAGRPDPAEQAVLDRQNRPPGYRLACRMEVRSRLTIRITPEAAPATIAPLTEGRRREVAVDPPLKKFVLSLPRVSLDDPVAAADALLSKFSGPKPVLAPTVLSALAGFDPGRDETVTAVLYDDRVILAVESGDSAERAFGAAVDLGTTTVVVEIVDLNDGRTMATAAGLNGQVRFGADVVSRISAAHLDPGNLLALRDESRRTINALLAEATRKAAIDPAEIYEVVVAGNTAMSHLFLGLPVSTLAVAPFQALFSSLEPLAAAAGGLDMNPAGMVYMAPNIKSFVGGDIAAGLVAVDIENGPARALFLDLGTNGEIVLKNGPRLLATSTAAGPAFEGMGLSCGMIAAPGAVYKAAPAGDGIRLRVVGEGEPKGICGSGLIDILAVAVELGWMAPNGQMRNERKSILLAPNLRLIQKDVRDAQLAAAAVKTGMRMLLAEAKLSVSDIERIYVAGAFGSTLDIGNAMRIGLIPAIDEEKIEFVGNASLAGAKILLLSALERARCEQSARRIRHVSLAQGREFQNIFIEMLEFNSWK